MGDYLRAVDALEAGESVRARIAQILGVRAPLEAEPLSRRAAPAASRHDLAEEAPAAVPVPRTRTRDAPPAGVWENEAPGDAEIEPAGTASEVAAVLSVLDAMSGPPPPPPHDPLFDPYRARALVAASLASPSGA